MWKRPKVANVEVSLVLACVCVLYNLINQHKELRRGLKSDPLGPKEA